jgi:hypothetical protein
MMARQRQADESHVKRRYAKCGLGFAYPVSALHIMRRAIVDGWISDFNFKFQLKFCFFFFLGGV